MFGSPTAGWISNRNLSSPQSGPPGAALLENFFPTATGVVVRRGSAEHAVCGDGSQTVQSLFTYTVGDVSQMFAAVEDEIFDVSISGAGVSVLDELTSGDWSVVQFATAAGSFLIGVNGEDDAFLYDGSTFGTTAITFPGGSGLTTADLSRVWAYKSRLWFLEKNSLNAWYLPVDQIGGELELLPLGGVFQLGGTLLFGQTWSLGFGQSGGLSEQNVFVSTEGEVVVYQGTDPATDFAKVGVYRVGNPMGPNSFIRAGGDLIVATDIGFIPLSKAATMDSAALAPGAVSFPIEVAWNDAVQRRPGNWAAKTWPEGQMVAIAVPPGFDGVPGMFVANARTGAWAFFTGWNGTCLEVFNGRLYFGSEDGKVVVAMVGGLDQGESYTARYIGLFDDLGTPASRKAGRVAMSTVRSANEVSPQTTCLYDFDMTLPPPPNAAAVTETSLWGVGEWGDAVWGASRQTFTTQDRVSLGGYGYRLAAAVQITSGSDAPVDAELVSVLVTYESAESFT